MCALAFSLSLSCLLRRPALGRSRRRCRSVAAPKVCSLRSFPSKAGGSPSSLKKSLFGNIDTCVTGTEAKRLSLDAAMRDIADADGEVREGVGKVGTGKGADGNINDDDDDDDDEENCREVLL